MIHERDQFLAVGDVVREQVHAHFNGVGEHHGALHHIFQFAHVPGPGVAHERPQGVGRNAAERTFVFLRVYLEEMVH